MKSQKDNNGHHLNWPWNIILYVLLVLILNIFSIPILIVLMSQSEKRYGSGFCLSRTRRRISCLLWALLFFFLAFIFFGGFFYQVPMDKSDWDTWDNVLFYLSAPAGLLFSAACIYMTYVGLRDAFFPERSALAKSIRSQLPDPNEAPPVMELFAAVDKDIRENGIWFDRIAVGKEWVLGDEASLLSRIRAVFGRDEVVSHGSGKYRQHTRVVELYILDDRKQAQISTLQNPNELPMLIDCLKLRSPDAVFLPYNQYYNYLHKSAEEWEALEKEYRSRREQRESKTPQVYENQNMILSTSFSGTTSRVTADLVRQTLQEAVEYSQTQDEALFDLTPSQPFQRDGVSYSLMQCAVFGSQLDENRNRIQGLWIYLVLVPVAGPNGRPVRNSMELSCTKEQAEAVLLGWLRGEVPDIRGWAEIDLSGMQVSYTKSQPDKTYPQKLRLISASGTAQSHERFSREDVEIGADGILNGSYKQMDLTLVGGYLWIQVTVDDGKYDSCTVTATRADGDKLRFFKTTCTARQAKCWLIDYYDGNFRPGGSGWKDITSKIK